MAEHVQKVLEQTHGNRTHRGFMAFSRPAKSFALVGVILTGLAGTGLKVQSDSAKIQKLSCGCGKICASHMSCPLAGCAREQHRPFTAEFLFVKDEVERTVSAQVKKFIAPQRSTRIAVSTQVASHQP